jgi:hypothetical protein
MMRVTVEIVPFGQEKDKYTLHTIEIGNMGRHKEGQYDRDGRTYCRYNAWLDGEQIAENILHAREDGALNLIERVLTHRNIERWLAETEFDTKEKSHEDSRKAVRSRRNGKPQTRPVRAQRKITKAAPRAKA